jgi:hypothetical protein
MDADFSIELSREDPVLDLPWKDANDASGKIAYFDLKRQPELIASITEARQFPELAKFLVKMNSPHSALESAKCDVWATNEMSAEESIFNASHKFASYVDLLFCDVEHRKSLPFQESFVRSLTELLRRAPEIGASLELCVRKCFYEQAGESDGEPEEGLYFTLYLNGYGNDDLAARRNWAIGMKLAESAILQLCGRMRLGELFALAGQKSVGQYGT